MSWPLHRKWWRRGAKKGGAGFQLASFRTRHEPIAAQSLIWSLLPGPVSLFWPAGKASLLKGVCGGECVEALVLAR